MGEPGEHDAARTFRLRVARRAPPEDRRERGRDLCVNSVILHAIAARSMRTRACDRRKNHKTPERRPVVPNAPLERGRRARERHTVKPDVHEVVVRKSHEDEPEKY